MRRLAGPARTWKRRAGHDLIQEYYPTQRVTTADYSQLGVSTEAGLFSLRFLERDDLRQRQDGSALERTGEIEGGD